MVVEKPKYWETPEQEATESKAIVAAYKRALQQRATHSQSRNHEEGRGTIKLRSARRTSTSRH
ncbi:hypothetical protein GQ600_7661 [Phytophthora cactorum]|nr:hypothetical protein GQ600_7661 [Phytophthora cactorum]